MVTWIQIASVLFCVAMVYVKGVQSENLTTQLTLKGSSEWDQTHSPAWDPITMQWVSEYTVTVYDELGQRLLLIDSSYSDL